MKTQSVAALDVLELSRHLQFGSLDWHGRFCSYLTCHICIKITTHPLFWKRDTEQSHMYSWWPCAFIELQSTAGPPVLSVRDLIQLVVFISIVKSAAFVIVRRATQNS